MSEEENGKEVLGLTEKIVSAHVANHAVSSADLPDLIRVVHQALADLTAAGVFTAPRQPVVPIKKSVTPNYLICLEDGKKFKMLKRYLRTTYNMTPNEYRERWGLPPDYPVTAPNYAKARSEIAKRIGLGRKRQTMKPKGKSKGAT